VLILAILPQYVGLRSICLLHALLAGPVVTLRKKSCDSPINHISALDCSRTPPTTMHWGDAKGIPGFWASGPGCGLSCGEQTWPKGQALAFADIARGLGAVDVAHMRSALGLSSTYISSAKRMASSPAENPCCCAHIKTEQRMAFF
jgi:hypothetical protein